MRVDEPFNFHHNMIVELFPIEKVKSVKGYGERIKKYRTAKKLTQEELGVMLGGITKSYISKVENEITTPSLEMMANIAEKLDVDIGDLIGGKQTPPKELKDAGTDWIILGEELEKEGITPEQVKIWAEIVRKSIPKSQ